MSVPQPAAILTVLRVGLGQMLRSRRHHPAGFRMLVGVAVSAAIVAIIALFVVLVPDGATFEDREQRARIAIAGLLSIPAFLLVSGVARLSALTRQQQLAGLFLLGVPQWQTRVLAAMRGVADVAPGIVGGLVVSGLFGAWNSSWSVPGVLLASVGGAALSMAALVALAGVPAHGRRKRARDFGRVPRVLRVCFLIAIYGALSAFTFFLDQINPHEAGLGWLLVVVVITAPVAMVVAVPEAARAVAKALVKGSPRPMILLAARWIQNQHASLTRATVAIGGALTLIVGAAVYYSTVLQRPSVWVAVQADTTGPATAYLAADGLSPQKLEAILGDPRVLHAAGYWAQSELGNVYYGSCRDLHLLTLGAIDECPKAPVWISSGQPVSGKLTLQLEGAGQAITIRAPTEILTSNPKWGGYDPAPGLFIPNLPATAVPQHPSAFMLQISPGRENFTSLQQDAAMRGITISDNNDFQALEEAERIRDIFAVVGGAMLLLALASLLLQTADAAMQRRPLQRHLEALGVPQVTYRGALILALVIPLTSTAVVASITGYLTAGPFAGPALYSANIWAALLLAVGVTLTSTAAIAGTMWAISGNRADRTGRGA